MVKSDILKVNKKLESEILGKIPENYSNLEKAIFIYYELCKKLNYSLAYFLNDTEATNRILNVKNIENVDGDKNTEVVCFTFNAILAKLLVTAKICDESALSNVVIDNNQFSPHHIPLVINIDGFNYIVDSSKGVFDNNDLTLSKYSTHKLTGWTPETFLSDSATYMLNCQLSKAIEKVQSDNRGLETNVNAYLSSKMLDNSYKELSLADRVQIFLIAIHNCPDYSVLAFNYLLKLKRKLFKNSEVGKNSNSVNIDLFFGKNNENNDLEAFLFYNPKGYIDDFGFENFDALEIYQISVKKQNSKKISLEDFKSKINGCSVITRGTVRKKYTSGMAIPGSLILTEIYEDNDPSKKVIGYTRSYHNGKTEVLSIPDADKLREIYNQIALNTREVKKVKNVKKWNN